MQARQVLVNFRDGVAAQIMRGATEDQVVAAVLKDLQTTLDARLRQ